MATRSMLTKYRPIDTTSSVSSNSSLDNNNENSSITIASPNNINSSEDDNAAKSSMNLSIQESNSESLEHAQFVRRSDLCFWKFSNDPRLMRAAHFLCHPSTKTDSSSKKDLYLQMKGYSEEEISRAKIYAASAKDEKGNLDRIWGSGEEETRSLSSNSVSSPAPRNVFENWNCCSEFFTYLAAFIGFIITYACGFMVGVFPAILAVKAMLRILMRNEEWLKRWQSMETSGIIMNGTVVSREHEINEITGFHTYSVTMNYDGSIVTDDKKVAPIPSSTSTTNTKCFDSLTDGAKEIYEFTKFGTIVPLHVLHGHPNAAIPSNVLKRKIADIHFWTKYGDPFIAVWGMVVYFMCAELFLKTIELNEGFEVDEGFTMIYRAASIGGVLLMSPCLYAHTRFQFKEDQQKFLEEPASILTQTDVFRIIWHKLGPTGWKKACLFAFIPGLSLVLILGVVFGGLLALEGVWGMVYTLKFGPKWEAFLQDLKKDSIIAHGVVIERNTFLSRSETMIPEVKARYSVAPPNGIGYYTVVTTTDSKSSYLRCSLHGNVDLYVNPETPRSGIIDSDFKDMMFQARLWNWFLAPLDSVFGLGTALGLAYLVYDGDFFCIMLLALGFVLIAPQIYVLAENSFNKAKKSLLEKGEIEAIVGIVHDVIPRHVDSAHLELATMC
eukprot:scaffold1886_cov157-Chaetoceros_neogracile.AAC.3